MSFENTERIIALSPELIGQIFPPLLAQYGELLPDGNKEILTIGAHWDDSDKTRIRAASLFDGTIQPIPLTDGRVCYIFLCQSDLAAAFDSGLIEGVEELTVEQLEGLRVKEE